MRSAPSQRTHPAHLLEHRTVASNGHRFHVAQAGPEEGPLVLLLHGFPEFWYGWRRQIAWLAARGFRVWAPDQRGYNLSDRPRGVEAYRLDHLTDDVLGLVEASGRTRAHLVGHDWGGVVGWRFAERFPGSLDRLAILNAPHPAAMRARLARDPVQAL